MSDLSELGTTIRELRKIRWWSIRDLADEAGVSRAAICDCENGKTLPKLPTLIRIAEAFECDASDLLNDAGL